MRKLCVVCGLLAGLGLACSDDEGEAPEGDASLFDASMEGGVLTGGSGGSGGSGGTTTSGGTGGTVTTPPLMCGDTTCPPTPGQDLVDGLASLGLPVPGLYQSCCVEDGVCGLNVMSTDDGGLTSTECVPRPEDDPLCPERNLFGVLQPGCCIAETGMCGVNTAQIGGGCEDYSTNGLFAAILGFSPVPCGGDDGGT